MSKITNTGLFITEGAAAAADVADNGQIWVKSDVPSSLYHTDDAGNDLRMGGFMVTAEVATTSGASVDVTGIPAGVRNVIVFLQGVSTSGTSEMCIQLGDSGGIETSGYLACAWDGDNADGQTARLILTFGMAAGETRDGAIRLALADVTNNTWVSTGLLNQGSSSSLMNGSSGTISLSGALTQIRITTVGGSDTFDAGSINLMYQ